MSIENEHKIVVSVGAGVTQLPFIRAVKDRGYKVAAFGKGRNDQEAIQISDFFGDIDTSNQEEAIRWLESLPHDIAAVGSYAGGVAIKTLQAISRYFNLPTNVPEVLSVGMDKFEQQKIYERHGLSSIKTFKYDEVKEHPNLIQGVSKFIIKPAIGRGSAGVYEVDHHQLEQILNENSFNANDMIQELKVGDEYRMLVIAQNYQIKLLAPIRRESFNESFLLGRLSYHPDHIETIKDYVTTLLRNLNLKDVIIKSDIIISENSVDMIEMDIGVGGGLYFKEFISYLFKYDITNEYINLITGHEVAAATYVDETAIMDYVYNLSGQPISYNSVSSKDKLADILGEDFKIIPNLLRPEMSGRFGANSDFIFCVIHQNRSITNQKLNQFVNEEIFTKPGGE